MNVIRHLAYVLAGTIALYGCGDGGGGSDGDGDGDGGGDGGGTVDASPVGTPDAFVPPTGSLTLEWGPINVPGGDEDTRCIIKKLGNPEPIKVHQIHNVLGQTSHHFIVYRVADQPEQTTPVPCTPFEDSLNPANGSPLMITQKFDETLTLPDGVAFELPANATIKLEMHYINVQDGEREVHATSTFAPIADEDFVAAADFVFMGDLEISLPPMQASTLPGSPSYLQIPAALEGANFFAITGHEHQWGTGVTVEAVAGEGQTGTMVYAPEEFNWDEPEVIFHDPTFQVPPGGGFNLTCEWFNGSNETVTFGEGANEEMCFFWAYYYPSAGAFTCFKRGFIPDASGTVCCPGNPFCSFL